MFVVVGKSRSAFATVEVRDDCQLSESLHFLTWTCCLCSVSAAVGACVPYYQELDTELMQSAVVIVDSKEAAVVESGDIIMAKVTQGAKIHLFAPDLVKTIRVFVCHHALMIMMALVSGIQPPYHCYLPRETLDIRMAPDLDSLRRLLPCPSKQCSSW